MLLKVIFLRPKSLLINLYKKECEKEKITADDAIFYNFRSKELAWKNSLFQICTIVIIFCSQVWKGVADSKKTKRLSKDKTKKQLLESIIINEAVESEELNKKAEEMQESEEAAKVIKQYEDIIKTKKNGIISIAYYQ